MEENTIEVAYAPFVAALRQGNFSPPAEGWTAELVAAHVALNNDLIAQTAERIIAGEQPTYNNTEVVDDEALRVYADSLGGLDGLADAVATSARRLATTWAALDDRTANYLMPTTIFDAGVIARDEPTPLGVLIEVNASYHINLHFEQLMALRS